ncbi:hypothetical protein M758_2G039300 [Ceratodon purpureus]|nr:hypothetical protein M758_2G039300 [Ceratodon purpureus]
MRCIVVPHVLQMHMVVVLMGNVLFIGSGSRVFGSSNLRDGGMRASDTGLRGTHLFTGSAFHMEDGGNVWDFAVVCAGLADGEDVVKERPADSAI